MDHNKTTNSKVSNWLRQYRHKQKKSGVKVDILLSDVLSTYEKFNYLCAYCDKPAGSPDLLFNDLCIVANIVPCCNKCKKVKKDDSIISMHQNGKMTVEKLSALLKKLTKLKGGAEIKKHLKSLL